jgi:hypothetical protein
MHLWPLTVLAQDFRNVIPVQLEIRDRPPRAERGQHN